MWGIRRKCPNVLQVRHHSVNLTVKVALSKRTRKFSLDPNEQRKIQKYASEKHFENRGFRLQRHRKSPVLFQKALSSGRNVLKATIDEEDLEGVLERSGSLGLRPVRTDNEGEIITSNAQLHELSTPRPLYTFVRSPCKTDQTDQTSDYIKVRENPEVVASSLSALNFRTNLSKAVHSIVSEMDRPNELRLLQWQGRGFSSTWTLKREARDSDPKQERAVSTADDTDSRALQMRRWYRRMYKRLAKGSNISEEEKTELLEQMMQEKNQRAQMADNWYTVDSNLASRNWYYDSKIEEVQNVSSVIPHFEYSYPHHNPGKVYPKAPKIKKEGKKKKKK